MKYFVTVDTVKRRPVAVGGSARKARKELENKHRRVDVWEDGKHIVTVYKQKDLALYVAEEKDYIRKKQERRTWRNRTIPG